MSRKTVRRWQPDSHERVSGISGAVQNGQKSTEAFYEDDKRHGVTTHWSPNGKVTGRYCYKNGNVVRTDAEEWKSVCRNGR